ncbi:CHAT domain-containing protein [Rhodohalobacter sp. 614A]|uniref:CHAT domain-containing protein n=1 Tax=Rhodohalobacter sp. 614A TaxID=2908649 RepID=UPI001F432525|nr:CHAT domain-containing protein [Rhodohalobacter sp. 614A]
MSQIRFKHLFFAGIVIIGTCIISQKSFSIQVDSHDLAIYDNWLSVQKSVNLDTTQYDVSIYDRLSEKYFLLYQTTHHEAYLNFALHEAGRSKRNEILNRIPEDELENINSVIAILNNRTISSEFYSIHPFSYQDIYRFLIFGIPDSLKIEADELLDFWFESLPNTYQTSSVVGAMKAQALVHGYNRLDNFQKVYEVGRYLVNSHPFPNSNSAFHLFNIIAYSARASGYYSDAIDIYENILFPMAENLNYRERYLIIRMDYANTLFRFGNLNTALNEYEYVYSQGIQNLDSRYRPALLNNLAISYLNAGKFDQYVQFQLDAFEIAREEENFDQQLDILRNLFIFYRRQNETELAVNYLNQALELAKTNNLLSETSSILLSLGVYKRETQNNPQEALQHFLDALDLSQNSNNYQQLFNSYVDLSETFYLLNDFENAEKYITSAIEVSQSRDDRINYTKASIRYGNLLTDYGRFEDAKSTIRGITNEDLNQIQFYLKVLGKNVQIKLLIQDQKVLEAIEISSSIIDEILNWLQESTDLQTGHMRMDEEFSEAFRLHTELLYELGNYEEAIAITGKLRNLSRAGFYNNPLLKSQILSEEQLIEDYNLSNRIQDLRNRYANANEEQKVYLGNQLVEAVSERNTLQNEAFPNYSENSFEDTLPLAMEKLDSDQLVIYFSIFENQVFQFFVSNDDIGMKAYPAEDQYLDVLEEAVASFGHGSTDLNLLHNVYQTFYAGNIPEHINHIYVIPDGIFYRLPVEILPTEPTHFANSYGSASYLIENYSVSYLNTLSDLISESPDANFSFDMAGFGISDFSAAGHPELPDLPFSPKEITDSANKLEKLTNKRFFLDENSTESNFRDVAGKAKIIHLATHSKVNDESPLFSSLYLHSGAIDNTTTVVDSSFVTQNDGIIYAYELFDLNLNADLIFLSSCESGTGGYLKGSGILGFSRAFTYAGAQSLSINLWPIRDQTASDISLHFYEALNEGKNKADALREARLSYLNNTNSDPYLWGAFIMYGNIESPVSNNQFYVQLLILVFLIAGLFLAVYVYQKKSLIKSWIF